MKKIHCTKCGQVFWTELEVDEALIASGEWIQNPCPKCGAEWAVVEPGIRRPRVIRRGRAKPGPKRIIRPRKAALPLAEKTAGFSPTRIRSLRKKLGISQKELAALTGVSSGAIVSWEKGKFKPKKDKADRLAAFAKMGKEEVRNLLAEKLPQSGEKKPEDAQIMKAKGGRKERRRKKQVPLPH